jgi:hypothetical protein
VAKQGDGAFTLQATMTELLAASWVGRWELLRRHPELLHESVADVLADSDPLLGLVVASAAEVGTKAVRSTFDAAYGVWEVTSGAIAGGEALARVEAGAAMLCDDGKWAATLLDAAIKRLNHDHNDVDLGRLRSLHLAYLVRVTAADMKAVDAALRLANANWPDVWAEIAGISNVERLLLGAFVVRAHADEFDPGDQLVERAGDLVDLLEATGQRGHGAAVEEHRLVLSAREVIAHGDVTGKELAEACEGAAAECGLNFQRTGARWVLQAAIGAGHEAIVRTPLDHPDRAGRLSNHATILSLAVHAGLLGPSILTEAVDLQSEAVSLTPAEHPNRATVTSNMGNRLADAVNAGVMDPSVLSQAADFQREAVKLTPPDHPDRAAYASNLGGLLADAVNAGVFDRSVLAEAVKSALEAVELTPSDCSVRAAYLSNLANLLSDAAHAGTSDRSVLNEAAGFQREAVELTPPDHPDRAQYKSNLAGLLADAVSAGVFDRSVLTEAIESAREAVNLTPPEHPNRCAYVSNLGTILSDAVDAGVLDRSALAEAADLHRGALESSSSHHPDRASYASSLASLLSDMVNAGLSDRSAFSDAVDLQREAVRLTAPEHPNRPRYVSNLAVTLADAMDAGLLDESVLVEAVEFQSEAVEHTPLDHPDRAGYSSSLASLLATAVSAGVFDCSVLREAIDLQRQAVALTPTDHPDRARYLSNLGTQFSAAVRAGLLDRSVLTEAVSLQREAVELTPADHASRAMYVSNLGYRWSEAVQAGVLAGTHGGLLVDHVWDSVRRNGAGGGMRRSLLRDFQGAITAAPWLEYWAGNIGGAIECVEAGRNHLFGVRAEPTDHELPVVHRASYREARAVLERAEMRLRDGLGSDVDVAACRDRFNEVIDKIRAEPGFEAFGSRPKLDAIARHVADDELLVYLVSGETGGLALTVDGAANVQAIVLPGLSTSNATERVGTLFSKNPNITLLSRWIWNTIIEPLLDHVPARKLTIVPTGVLVLTPVHAAGSRGTGWIDDQRTIRVLPSALTAVVSTHQPASGPDLVMISHAQDLFFLNADFAVATKLNGGAKTLEATTATVNAALHAIDNANRVVISGHGRYDNEDGAGISLVDGMLTADAIARLPARNRGIVILNACVTSQVSAELLDEAIGLPNALLAAGFHGVYATQWPIKDTVAFITSARLQQTISPANSPAETMRATRAWLRNLTGRALKDWFEELEQTVQLPVDRNQLNNWLARHNDNDQPFTDPADWAAFTYIGH